MSTYTPGRKKTHTQTRRNYAAEGQSRTPAGREAGKRLAKGGRVSTIQPPSNDSDGHGYGSRPKYDSFPIVSEFEQADMDLAIELMTEDVLYKEQEDAVVAARRDIKKELAAISQKYDVAGMRHGQLVTYYGGMKTKKTLSKTKLVENGVDLDVIEASYSESAPYPDVRVVNLSKPRVDGKKATEE
jgi:hypothetical protein